MESYTTTLEGAEVTFLCQITFQLMLVGQQSPCVKVNITNVCTKEGKWVPVIADDVSTCAGVRGLTGIQRS